MVQPWTCQVPLSPVRIACAPALHCSRVLMGHPVHLIHSYSILHYTTIDASFPLSPTRHPQDQQRGTKDKTPAIVTTIRNPSRRKEQDIQQSNVPLPRVLALPAAPPRSPRRLRLRSRSRPRPVFSPDPRPSRASRRCRCWRARGPPVARGRRRCRGGGRCLGRRPSWRRACRSSCPWCGERIGEGREREERGRWGGKGGREEDGAWGWMG